MVDWQKHKAAEEERLEQEHKLQKKMKELAVKQVLDTQKRTADSKALRDEVFAYASIRPVVAEVGGACRDISIVGLWRRGELLTRFCLISGGKYPPVPLLLRSLD